MTSQMRLDTRLNNIKNSPPERFRCVTEDKGQFPLIIVSEVKGTETE